MSYTIITWTIARIVAKIKALHPVFRKEKRRGLVAGFNFKFFRRHEMSYMLARAKRNPARWARVRALIPAHVRRDLMFRCWRHRDAEIFEGLRALYARFGKDRQRGALADPPGTWGPNYVLKSSHPEGAWIADTVRRRHTILDDWIGRMRGPIRKNWRRVWHPWNLDRARKGLIEARKKWRRVRRRLPDGTYRPRFGSLFLHDGYSWILRGAGKYVPGGIDALARSIPSVGRDWSPLHGLTDVQIQEAALRLLAAWERDPRGKGVLRLGPGYSRKHGFARYTKQMELRGIECVLVGERFGAFRAAWRMRIANAVPFETIERRAARLQELSRARPAPPVSASAPRPVLDEQTARAQRLRHQHALERSSYGLTKSQIVLGLLLAHRQWVKSGGALGHDQPAFDRTWLRAAGLTRIADAADRAPYGFDMIARAIPEGVRYDWVDRKGKRVSRPPQATRVVGMGELERLARYLDHKDGGDEGDAVRGSKPFDPVLHAGFDEAELEEAIASMG